MNPFEVLGLERNADKREIIMAAAAALRERRWSGKEVAVAQKQLLNPKTKAELEFLFFLSMNIDADDSEADLQFAEITAHIEEMQRLDTIGE